MWRDRESVHRSVKLAKLKQVVTKTRLAKLKQVVTKKKSVDPGAVELTIAGSHWQVTYCLLTACISSVLKEALTCLVTCRGLAASGRCYITRKGTGLHSEFVIGTVEYDNIMHQQIIYR